MKDSPSSMPIKSLERAKELAKALKKQHPPYAMLFWLLIGTGAPLPYLLTLTVQDLKFSGQLHFYLKKNSKRPIISDIPIEIQNEVGDYYFPQEDSNPAFLSLDGETVITISEFRMRLARTSIDIGFPAPGLNETALRKTYLYTRTIHFKDPQGAMDFMGWKSKKKLFAYLGLAKFTKKDKSETTTVIYDDTTIDNVQKECLELIEQVNKAIKEKDNTFNANEAMAIIAFYTGLKRLTSEFKNSWDE